MPWCQNDNFIIKSSLIKCHHYHIFIGFAGILKLLWSNWWIWHSHNIQKENVECPGNHKILKWLMSYLSIFKKNNVFIDLSGYWCRCLLLVACVSNTESFFFKFYCETFKVRCKRLSLEDMSLRYIQRKVAEKSKCVCISIPLAWAWVQRSQQWVSGPRGGPEVGGHFLVMLIGSILSTTRRRGRGQLLLWPCEETADTSGQSLHPSLTNKHGKRWSWIPMESGSNRSQSSATIYR